MRLFKKEVDYYLYNYPEVKKSGKTEDQKWVKIIEQIKSKYEGTPYGELIRLKYDMKLKEIEICQLLHVERPTYYAWTNKINNEVTLKAAYERLIIPF